MKRFFGKRFSLAEVAGLLAVGLVGVAFYASAVTIPNTFTRDTTISSSQMNANFQAVAQAIANIEAGLNGACASGFTRVGLWCLDSDGLPSVHVRNASSSENNSGSTATNLDTLLGLSTGTVRAAVVRSRIREIVNAASASAFACVASVPLSVSSILICPGVAIDTNLTTSPQAVGAQTENLIPVDSNGNIHTLCAWGSGTSNQAICSWDITGYID